MWIVPVILGFNPVGRTEIENYASGWDAIRRSMRINRRKISTRNAQTSNIRQEIIHSRHSRSVRSPNPAEFSSRLSERVYLCVSVAVISRVKFLIGEEMFSVMETVWTRPWRRSLLPVLRIGVSGFTGPGEGRLVRLSVDGFVGPTLSSGGEGGSPLDDVSLESVL